MRPTRYLAAFAGIVVALSLAAPGAASAAVVAPTPHVVKALDDCDPATFNDAIGPGTCVGDGTTTFQDFVGQLSGPKHRVMGWRFNPNDLTIPPGDVLRVRNVGGEFHTFTPVAHFGGGCVDVLNDLSGGLTPVPECDRPNLLARTSLPVDAVLRVGRDLLPVGVHRFECMIHPWMRTTVTVQ